MSTKTGDELRLAINNILYDYLQDDDYVKAASHRLAQLIARDELKKVRHETLLVADNATVMQIVLNIDDRIKQLESNLKHEVSEG